MELTSLSLVILFGVNFILHYCFIINGKCGIINSNEKSLPLEKTVSSIRLLTKEISKFGFILLFSYICEYNPIFPNSEKVDDIDMVLLSVIVLLMFSLLNIKKSSSDDFLNREQTEEWKGWMQFMFLLYHYFSVHEIYNPVRVFVTSYIWMTGFGNFSFFYIKSDYSLVRIFQMLWRLNFLVFFLCMTMGNNYILYYICPLHTFYFFMVYTLMAIGKSYNYTEKFKYKLFVLAIIIFVIWDLDMNIFEKIFCFLGNESIEGAPSGTMWEWYFRTSLDHWSTFLGIIFALNYPTISKWKNKLEVTNVKYIVGSFLGVLLMIWIFFILPLDKKEYNKYNAYMGSLVPMLVYIYLRNITHIMRSYYLKPLHDIGKITLETYLMQHHLWLNNNAKTVLVFVPGFPKVNMVIVGVLYLILSKQLFKITMYLRGMLLPDDLKKCIMNLLGMVSIISITLILSKFFIFMEFNCFFIGIFILLIGIMNLVIIHYILYSDESYDGFLIKKRNISVIILCIVSILFHYINTSKDDWVVRDVNKNISGMGNIWMGICVCCISCIMIYTRDSFYGLVLLFGKKHLSEEDKSWSGIYTGFLHKLGKIQIDEIEESDKEFLI